MVPLGRFLVLLLAMQTQGPGTPATTAPGTPPHPQSQPALEGIAARHPGDVGIEKDPAVLFASGFENGLAGWTTRHPGIFEIIDDPAMAHSGRRCARATATRGKNAGGEIAWTTPNGKDQVYLRFYCKFDKDTCWPHHFVKLRALANGFTGDAGKPPPGDKGFWTGIEPLRGTWRLYAYWHKMRGWNNPPAGAPAGSDPKLNDDGTENKGPNDFYGNSFTPDAQPPVPKDRWICVEVMMKANTVGASDGEMAFWIDGKKVGCYRTGEPIGSWLRNIFVTSDTDNTPRRPAPFPGFDFRTVQTLKINEISLLWYVSEEYAAKATQDENRCSFDDVVVATEYIGPMAAEKK